jgi:hypothetical protein
MVLQLKLNAAELYQLISLHKLKKKSMHTEEGLKKIVKDNYSEITLQDKERNISSCFGLGRCSTEGYSIMSDDYCSLQKYNYDPDLGLGCRLPTLFAKIKIGDVVVEGSLPEDLRKDAGMYAGYVSRVIQNQAYLELIHPNGFKNIRITVFASKPKLNKNSACTHGGGCC